MRHVSLLIASATLVLAACSSHDSPGVAARGAIATPQRAPIAHTPRTIATLPDRGHLLTYADSEPVRRTAYTWHAASLSEAHALRAIVTGTLEVEAPDGTPIRLRYARHVEHEDGNWTWVGRPDDAQPGTEAIITFGEKAVFGSVPNPKGGPPLRITTTNGRTWVMETDPRVLKRLVAEGRAGKGDDVQSFPALAGARDQVVRQAALTPQKLTAAGAVPESATVDVAIGYTNTFASRLGGTSQALTRLRYLVDVSNVAFSNSQIVGQVRLAGTVALNYPDNTDNGDALDQLTGMTCGATSCEDVPIPAALQPLHTLREQVGADLISLVRNFSDPENQSCGNAWLLGGGGEPMTSGMAYAAVSVVSDSNGNLYPDNDYICRDETFVHELAHNMGSNHDAETSAGDDGVVDQEDQGVYPYSFGYKTSVGNFYTIMAYRDEGQTPYRVFSNPRIQTCGGYNCGTADADNARSLGQTMPLIAAFLTATGRAKVRHDFDNDNRSDILWRHVGTGNNSWWGAASSAAAHVLLRVADQGWKIAGTGDFDADGRDDVLWRHAATGNNSIWRAANASAALAVARLADMNWSVAGVGDFNGDGRADILWRNGKTGGNSIWRSGNIATAQLITTVPLAWKIVGVGDIDADGKDDIVWRNGTTGSNSYWPAGNSAQARLLATVGDQRWTVVGVADFNGDGRADILWRNTGTGQNLIWWAGVQAGGKLLATVTDQASKVVGTGDYDGDGFDDILWRNANTGVNTLWKRGDAARAQTLTRVADLGWKVAG